MEASSSTQIADSVLSQSDFHQSLSVIDAELHDGLSDILDANNEYIPDDTAQNLPSQHGDAVALDDANSAQGRPRFTLPARPCEYCASRQLVCLYTYDGQKGCSACRALFRTCSFIDNDATTSQTLMDTLHVVQEDTVQFLGAPTGAKALRSWDRTPLDRPSSRSDDRSSKKNNGTRFSREALKTLKSWIDQHADYPYPSEDEKDQLAALTNLSEAQISNWFANTRRRNKQKAAKGMSSGTTSPVWPPSCSAIDIPASKKGVVQDGKTWDVMNPMERWKASPPENEPAAVDAIAEAIASSRLSSNESIVSQSRSRRKAESSGGSGSASMNRAPSITSQETGQSDSHISSESFHSFGSSRSRGSRTSTHSYGSGHRMDRRRRKRHHLTASRTQEASAQRPFQCTFCTDTFRTKYDWTRHEKSLHLSLEKWICAPLGDVITDPTSGHRICVYCEKHDPDEDHLKRHGHDQCEEKGMKSRTFYRKDHLRQHLRLVHGCPLIPSMDTWKSEATYIRSRCGFCAQIFTSWTERCDHIAKHFRSGSHMRDWRGCRGFDAEVSAFVTNAMPPFLIGAEASSVNPFSASNEAFMGHHGGTGMNVTAGSLPQQQLSTPAPFVDWTQEWTTAHDTVANMLAIDGARSSSMTISMDMNVTSMQQDANARPNARVSTCWEILTIRLGQYLQEQLRRGEVPTDEMLQHQARWILYESDDDWNQTAADNPEWLELFKKAHGMPSKATDTWVDWSEDLGGVGELSFDALTFQDYQQSTTFATDVPMNAMFEPLFRTQFD